MFIFFPAIIWADTPPSWETFMIESDNGKYLAELVIEKKHSKPWESKYWLKVSTKESKAVLWTCPYNYDGYPEGILSDDGATFVYVNYWYSETGPVVSIYYRGLKQHRKTGKDFHIDREKLVKTASH